MRRNLSAFCLSLWIVVAPVKAQGVLDSLFSIMPRNTEFTAVAPALGTMGAIVGAHLLPGWLLAAGVPTYVGGTIAGTITGAGVLAGFGGLALGAAAGVGVAIAGFYLYNWLRGQTYMNNRASWDRWMNPGRSRADAAPRPRESQGVALLGQHGGM